MKSLILGKERGVADKLVALQDRYTKISNQAKAVESYLDWYEASETQNYSGAFDDYLKLRATELEKEFRPRGDAPSRSILIPSKRNTEN